MEKRVFISCSFSLFLLGARMLFTGSNLFLFLAWNLFLACIPFLVSSKWETIAARLGKWHFLPLFLFWLLFLPNSFYILTDLFHLELRKEANRWFDLTLIFSFAWNGLLMGILSLRQMEIIFFKKFPLKSPVIFLFPIMWLNALGIYIGRYLRYNSWDAITNPLDLSGDIGLMLLHPFQNFYAWGMIACFAAFLVILYLTMMEMKPTGNPGERTSHQS